MSEYASRMRALELALEYHKGKTASPSEIIETAKVFRIYLEKRDE